MKKCFSLVTSLFFLVSLLSVPIVHAQNTESSPPVEEGTAEQAPAPEKMSKGDRTKARGLRFQDQAAKKSQKVDVWAEKRKTEKMKGKVQKRTDMKMKKMETKVEKGGTMMQKKGVKPMKRRGGGGGGGGGGY